MLLEINGQSVSVADSLGDSRLVDVIRDHLGLKGTKFGCGIGQCGACTVHLNGVAVRSCLLTPGSIGSGNLTTIEGLAELSEKDELHPVQQAWVELSVPQCGYCQAGQIMTAASLLKQNQDPSEEQVEVAMDGNLCRCGTYSRIRCGVQRAVEITKEKGVGTD